MCAWLGPPCSPRVPGIQNQEAQTGEREPASGRSAWASKRGGQEAEGPAASSPSPAGKATGWDNPSRASGWKRVGQQLAPQGNPGYILVTGYQLRGHPGWNVAWASDRVTLQPLNLMCLRASHTVTPPVVGRVGGRLPGTRALPGILLGRPLVLGQEKVQ